MTKVVDLGGFRSSLDRCECECECVATCCHSPIDKPSSSGFTVRLIDIERRCIVNAKEAARYVALSYVWGQTRQLLRTQSALGEFTTEGTLDAHQHELSATIRDTMTLCERLGERCLWADTLCIIQDSLRNKMWQVSRMGRTYRGATLTVVAATGADADAGLPGLNHPIAAEKGKTLDTNEPPSPDERFEHAMSGCKWDTRGWTFQEKVLSARLLVFTETEAFFRCKAPIKIPTQSQTRFLEVLRSWFTKTGSAPSTSSTDTDLAKYTKLVEEYSCRELTYQVDAFKAFVGFQNIFATIRENSNTFTYGLPAAAFDFAFCWSAEEHRPDLRRSEFPTWSWVG